MEVRVRGTRRAKWSAFFAFKPGRRIRRPNQRSKHVPSTGVAAVAGRADRAEPRTAAALLRRGGAAGAGWFVERAWRLAAGARAFSAGGFLRAGRGGAALARCQARRPAEHPRVGIAL